MEPTFFEGERVLTFNWLKPKAGDVIVFNVGDKNLIKRVVKIKDDRFFFAGDNRKFSSRTDPIRSDQVIGKVILKY